MMSEMNLVKRYLGARFGYGEPLKDGIYAVPATTKKGKAFMRIEIKNGNISGSNNFYLFWDEGLTKSWYDTTMPDSFIESKFSKCFRDLEESHS